MASHQQVVRLAISGLVFAILFPIVMTSITTSQCKGFPNNTTSIPNLPAWCSGAVGTVFSVLFPILTVIAVVLLFVPRDGGEAFVRSAKSDFDGFVFALRVLFGDVRESFREFQANSAFLSNRRAEVSEHQIIGIAIAALLTAILFPIVMTSVTAPSTTLWGTAVTTVFQTLFPVLLIIAIVLHFVHKEKTG